MAQEIIFRKLNSAAEKVKSKYKPKNIFAVFYYGRAKLAAIVVHTFNDLCLDKNLSCAVYKCHFIISAYFCKVTFSKILYYSPCILQGFPPVF